MEVRKMIKKEAPKSRILTSMRKRSIKSLKRRIIKTFSIKYPKHLALIQRRKVIYKNIFTFFPPSLEVVYTTSRFNIPVYEIFFSFFFQFFHPCFIKRKNPLPMKWFSTMLDSVFGERFSSKSVYIPLEKGGLIYICVFHSFSI